MSEKMSQKALLQYDNRKLSRKQKKEIRQQLAHIESIRQLTVLALEDLGEVSVELTELFSVTLMEVEDLIYEKGIAVTAREQQQLRNLTVELVETLNDIRKSHRENVFSELEKQVYKLMGMYPKSQSLLPGGYLE